MTSVTKYPRVNGLLCSPSFGTVFEHNSSTVHHPSQKCVRKISNEISGGDLLTAKGNEFSDNTLTSHLFADGRRPDTAFQRYRNSRLGGEFHSEITGRSLSECLDECLRQVSFQCRSAVYSERFRICRLSRFNQRDGHRVIYDADYDYYENLMSK